MDSRIERIMDVGLRLVGEFMETGMVHTKANPVNNQYHLVFAKVWQDDQFNACLYDFSVSSHPLLIFGPRIYESRLKGADAEYWEPLVNTAYHAFGVIKGIENVTGMLNKGERLAPPVKPTPPPVRVIKNEQVIAGKLSDK